MPASSSWDALIAASALPRLEARALAQAASGRAREWLIGHGDETAPEPQRHAFLGLAARRARGEPLAYLLGEREFHGHRLHVAPGVLIPRPETELLVDWAIRHAVRDGRVLELGTGSGAIAVSIAHARSDLRIVATDVSAAALAVARGNALSILGGRAGAIEFRRGHWYDALETGSTFEMIVANPPYIALGDPHLRQGDLRFEPALALTAGADGFDAIDAILAGARSHLAPEGWLAFEHGWQQGEPARARLLAAGFVEVQTLRDDEGRDRVGIGRL